jgi:ABC-type sugar transport system permease subunit
LATATSERLPAATTKTGTRTRRSWGGRDGAGWAMIAPFFIIYALFLLWPVIGALWSSLFDRSLGVTDGGFRGLGNYGELLGDGDFWASMWHTLLFTLLSTPPLVILALGLALLVNRALPAQWLFRLAFFAPYVLPVSVAVLLFNWLMQPGFGLINSTLVQLGFAEVNWLGDEGTAMFSVVIMTVWWTLGFNFVLYIAALQDIPKEIYEAAAMDGASTWQQTRSIAIPLLAPTTMLVLVLQVIASLKVFDQIYIWLQGGPNYSTRPAVQYIFESAFTQYRVGYASAASIVFFLAIILVSLVLFALQRRVQRSQGQDAPAATANVEPVK